MPEGGVEPPCPCGRWILSPLRLPFRHPGAPCEISFGDERNPNTHAPASAISTRQCRRVLLTEGEAEAKSLVDELAAASGTLKMTQKQGKIPAKTIMGEGKRPCGTPRLYEGQPVARIGVRGRRRRAVRAFPRYDSSSPSSHATFHLGRWPKSTVPSRTQVAPSSTATS